MDNTSKQARKSRSSPKVRSEKQKIARRARNQRRRLRRQAGNLGNAKVLPAMGFGNAAISDTGMRKLIGMMPRKETLTQEGKSFLKCAFAPPDFIGNDVAGVPDDFRGPSLVKKHRLVFTYNLTSSAVDYYFLVAPTPGVAFWVLTNPAGTGVASTSVFTPVFYSDFSTMFGPTTGATAADIVTKFRTISQHVELVPCVNDMSWTGNIQCFKAPMAMVLDANTVSTRYSVTGLQGFNSTNANQYTAPFKNGVYSAAYNAGAKFDFQPIVENQTALPNTMIAGDWGQLNGCVVGFDSQFDSIMIKVTGVTGTANTMIIKTWSCVEYQCSPGNLLYEFCSLSPSDPLALKLYREVILGLPVGVPYYQNEGFWERVLKIIRRLSGPLSVIPGPPGMIAGGIDALAHGIQDLAF